MKGNHPQHLELVIQQVAYKQWAVVSPLLWKSYLSCAMTWKQRALDSDMAGKEQRKEKRKEGCGRPIHRRGKRVMVSCCWPTLSDNWFLVCGSAWQDARRQEPSSAGRIPAVARERRQPGRRVLLDWFYRSPSTGLVHLYPSVELTMATPMSGLYLSTYLSSYLKGRD